MTHTELPELLEKPSLLKDLALVLPDLARDFSKAVPKRFRVSFEVEFIPAHNWHRDEFHVFMRAGGKRFQVDRVSEACLRPQKSEQKAQVLLNAYNEAYEDLKVTFQRASKVPENEMGKQRFSTPKPMVMAGWNVIGGDSRFVLKHKGMEQVYRNMAYVIGSDAHTLLEMEPHHAGDVQRAQMVFNPGF